MVAFISSTSILPHLDLTQTKVLSELTDKTVARSPMTAPLLMDLWEVSLCFMVSIRLVQKRRLYKM